MSIGDRKAWVVILTRSSYLAATVLLEYSLRRAKSKYPLYVLVTPSLPKDSRNTLDEAGCNVIEIDELRPKIEVSVVAARFVDTWDKLRAFGLEGFQVSRIHCVDELISRLSACRIRSHLTPLVQPVRYRT